MHARLLDLGLLLLWDDGRHEQLASLKPNFFLSYSYNLAFASWLAEYTLIFILKRLKVQSSSQISAYVKMKVKTCGSKQH